MPYFAISESASTRFEIAVQALVAEGSASEVVIVGASVDAAAEVARVAARGRATFGWFRLSLVQLAATLAGPQLAQSGETPAAGLVLEALVAHVVFGLAERGHLGRLAAIADRPGLPRALARTLAELRLHGVSAKQLALQDEALARVLLAYEVEASRAGLADRARLFEVATRAVHATPRHGLVGKPLVLVDVPVHAAAEARFVEALATCAPRVAATIPRGDVRTAGALTRALGRTPELRSSVAVGALGRLQRSLFAPTGEAVLPEPDASGVEILSAPGESRECVEIVRGILGEAARGTPFDRMAVLLRTPLSYRAHLEEGFRRARVPVFFARGTRQPDPAGRAFLALLACASEGLSASRFSEYLSLGEVPDAGPLGAPPPQHAREGRWVPPDDELTPLPTDEGDSEGEWSLPDNPDAMPVVAGQLRAPRHWERLLVDAAVIGGLPRWVRRLDGLRAKLTLDRGVLDDAADEAAARRIERDLSALESLRAFALPLLDVLAQFPHAASWRVWLDTLGELATRSLRRPDRVLSVLAELEPMAAVGPVSLAEVNSVLERRLGDLPVPPKGRRYGSVFVASAEEARGLSFDVVFVAGLAEKMFPVKVAEDPLLPDHVRDALAAQLPVTSDRAEGERLALRLAVGAAARRLVVSWPRIDLDQSRPRTPSFYALEVVHAATGTLPDARDLERRAQRATAPRLGWPAPSSPADAIDDAEHDLAVLAEWLHVAATESEGRARFLMTANPHLARALRARAERWHSKWYSSDGLVDPSPEARAALAAHDLAARAYSPTALQNYAACPYRFVLSAIHRLSPREEPAPIDDLDPLQRGSLVHEILYVLFRALRDARLLPLTEATLEPAMAHLARVTCEVAGGLEDELAPAIPRVWDDGLAQVRADLREMLRRMVAEPGWTPERMELSFGLRERRGNDEHSTLDPVELETGLRLRGSIDLVERGPDGRVRATDYKTGKKRAALGTLIGGGKTLQPVLYALALERLMPERVVEGGRLYYCTSDGGFDDVAIALDAESRQAARVVTETLRGALAQGFFPAAPAERECEYCEFRPVCGPYEEQRLSRKRGRDRLAPLLHLRAQR